LTACGSSSSTTSKTTSTTASTGNAADKAYAAEAVPDDQLAVQLAALVPAHTTHSQLKTFASSLTTAENAQIKQLDGVDSALGVKAAATSPTTMTAMEANALALGIQMYQMGMDQINTANVASAKPFDPAFLTSMITLEKGAKNMAQAELSKGNDASLRSIANSIVASADSNVSQLQSWQTAWYGSSKTSTTTTKSGGMSGMKGMKGMKGMSTTTTSGG
jgi:uncharacterized protein (DUF305 family)